MKELLDLIEDIIKARFDLKVVRLDEDILQLDKGKSKIFIDFTFKDEARLGINGVVEYLPIEGNTVQIIERFFKIISSEIEIIVYKKGKMTYKMHYNLILSDGKKELFGTIITWLFPYWKKTTTKVLVEEPLITEDEAYDTMERLIKTYNKN